MVPEINDTTTTTTPEPAAVPARSRFHIPGWLRNKYLIATAAFAVVMLFLDKNDLFNTLERRHELQSLRQSKAYFTKATSDLNKVKQALTNDPATVQKYARETLLMKKDNEDVFVIPENYDRSNN